MKNGWIGWLAGIIDGEGTIGITRSNAKAYKHPYLKPTFHISNTNTKILDKAEMIIRKIHPFTKVHITVTNRNVERQKTGYRLSVDSQKDMIKILPVIIPYLIAKKEQATLLLDFCTRRVLRLKHSWYEFGDLDQMQYQRCKEINRRGVIVESCGESPSQEGEGELRTTEGSVEVAETSTRLFH